ncbi:MAG: pyridoxal phosphate-dependent aminotransferase [Candidatus Jacksonbacteria bacterium]
MPTLSKRVQKLQSSGIRVIARMAAKIPNCIKLHIGIPNFFTPEHIKAAGIAAIKNNFTKYTHNSGEELVRRAIAKRINYKFRKMTLKHGSFINFENITVTAGGMGGLSTSITAITDPGDEILIPNPGWPNFYMIPMSQGVKYRFYPLKAKNGFVPQSEDIESKITKKTKVILINTPANPTGAVIPEKIIRQIVKLAQKYNLFILSDESYDDIIFEGTHFSPYALNQKHVIVVRSCSKSYAMTGWRVGYTISSKEIAEKLMELNECQIACVPSMSQMAAKAAIEGSQICVRQMVKSYKKRRDLVVNLLKKYELYGYTPRGAFYILVDISSSGLDSDEFARQFLVKKRVSVAPGSTFGSHANSYVRICFAASEGDISQGIKRLAEFIKHGT